jgi:hypothetical protein
VNGTGLSILFDPYSNLGYLVTYWASLLANESGFHLDCYEESSTI